MLTTSKHTLKVLAALVWHVGALVLLLKGVSLLKEAAALRPGLAWPWLALGAAVFAGGLKAKLIFGRSCARNLDRIEALEQARFWQFFKPQFFLSLAVMILVGATLSRQAHHNYPFLVGVAVLDLGIAIALLGSAHVFWRTRPAET